MRFPAAVAAALVLAALPVPAAQAAGCVWTFSGLPTHPNFQHERVTGMSPDGSITVGDGDNLDYGWMNGLVWFGTTPSAMADPNRGPGVDSGPEDVNNAGIAAGYAYDNNTGKVESYRYNVHDGTYEWLRAPHDNGVANFINERGDVAGWLYDGGDGMAVVWPAGSVRPLVIGPGQPVGLDEAGRIVTNKGRIWSPDGTFVQIKDLRGAHPTAYADGRAAGVGTGGNIIEWNLAGQVTKVTPGAGRVFGINASGVIAAQHGLKYALWNEDGPQDLEDGFVLGITDSGVAYGQRGWDAAIYRCV